MSDDWIATSSIHNVEIAANTAAADAEAQAAAAAKAEYEERLEARNKYVRAAGGLGILAKVKAQPSGITFDLKDRQPMYHVKATGPTIRSCYFSPPHGQNIMKVYREEREKLENARKLRAITIAVRNGWALEEVLNPDDLPPSQVRHYQQALAYRRKAMEFQDQMEAMIGSFAKSICVIR